MHRKRTRPDDWEELDPSPVIHIRDLPEHTLEIDLIKTFERYGSVKDVSMIPNKGQALLEFFDVRSAEDVVNDRTETIVVANRPVKVNFSTSTRIEHRSRGDEREKSGENNVLLYTIYNAIYPITVDVIKTICSPHGKILRIVIFRKNQVQAMVEFQSLEDARSAKKHLNGADIYSGCCTLKVEYARPTTLTVYKNDQDSWDFTGALERRPGVVSNSLLGLPEQSRSGVTLLPGAPSYDSHDRDRGGRSRNDYDPRDERSSRDDQYSSRNSVPMSSYPMSSMNMGMSPAMMDPWRGNAPQMSMSGVSSLPSNAILGSMMGGPQYANSPGAGNGEMSGSVAIVYGFNMEKINCDRVFNVFCLYGNVIRVKFLHSKPGAAMVQMGDAKSVDKIIDNLNNALLFGNKLEVQLSKQPNLKEMGASYNLPDGSQSFKDFSSSRNQRFSNPDAAAKNRLTMPTSTLHYWNCPPDYNDDDIKKLITDSGSAEPSQIQVFTARERSSSGLIDFESKWDAIDTLALINHTSIHHNDASRYPYLLKLCFSTSPIDSQGGEKKRSFSNSARHNDSVEECEDGEEGVQQIKTISGFRGGAGRRGRH